MPNNNDLAKTPTMAAPPPRPCTTIDYRHGGRQWRLETAARAQASDVMANTSAYDIDSREPVRPHPPWVMCASSSQLGSAP